MEKVNYLDKVIENYGYYDAFVDGISSLNDYIEVLESLSGKKDEKNKIGDCGVEFIKNLLERDCNRTIVYNYSNAAKEFLSSKYLSDYFKKGIKEHIIRDMEANNDFKGNVTNELMELLDSEKLINDMSEEEIGNILSICKKLSYNPECRTINNCFYQLLYKLDGEGVISYIRNNTNPGILAAIILETSGINNNASWYSGRGVNPNDLDYTNLITIFEKLAKYDINYAYSFTKMVKGMDLLGATEFINSYNRLSYNDFEYTEKNIENNNVSFNGAPKSNIGMVGLCSMSVGSNNRNQEIQRECSDRIKKHFLFVTKHYLKKQGLELNSEDYGTDRITKRR